MKETANCIMFIYCSVLCGPFRRLRRLPTALPNTRSIENVSVPSRMMNMFYHSITEIHNAS